MAAAAGCAGAVISGGKCANGAVSAAMAHLFNAEGIGRKAFKLIAKRAGPIAIAARISGRTFMTYTLRACETCPVEYVGRTSALDAAIDTALYARWTGHRHRDLPIMELDKFAVAGRLNPRNSSAYAAIRGREQQLIDFYGGARTDNPQTPLRNINRGVGIQRPPAIQRRYWRASNRYFGQKYKYTGR